MAQDDVISSEKFDEEVAFALEYRPYASFSEDNKYLLFTVIPGEHPYEMKTLRTVSIWAYDIEDESFIEVYEVDDDIDIFKGEVFPYAPA